MRPQTTRRRYLAATTAALTTGVLAGCTGNGTDGGQGATATEMDDGMETTTTGGMDDSMGGEPMDPDTSPRVEIDRFSEDAGMLMVRTADNGLPGPDEAIDFDQGPFVTRGLGPDGAPVTYYNFDVQSTTPAPIYVLFHEGEDTPVEGQLNVVDVVPGDDGYNDFWQVHRVTVPEDYVANTVTSRHDIQAAGYDVSATETLVNCPVVPDGSTATMRLGDDPTGLVEGWYQGQVVSYFQFTEAPLTAAGGSVPVSPIYVAFNTNPGEDGGGPASGFVTEAGSDRTHNVVATVPGDDGYSPLWSVNVYDNADFDRVSDLASATDAELLAGGVATVNCPLVAV
ncbi:hypothetical protein [Haloplanus aerogenes]|uniref:Uncharacterized protein n=1 Tax=Haloplanus aerogenes TaxID=660522 RepID=A0A3M0D1V8_9EURY|nr:hypothetical protein [Haloplanus aerogenes]AZH27093.1 hypothetical protein DU502_17690 [Haloplanus aerogenes]RMB13406.1 hypothetical protein ATH50_2739 [Haloplanus aerogenes]